MPSSVVPYLPPRGSDRGGFQNGVAGQVQDRGRRGCVPLRSAAASGELCARQTEGKSSSENPARSVLSVYWLANSAGPPLPLVCATTRGNVGYGAQYCAARESAGPTTHVALSRTPARSVFFVSSACGLANSAGMSSALPLLFDYANTEGNAGYGATHCATSGSVGPTTHVTLTLGYIRLAERRVVMGHARGSRRRVEAVESWRRWE